MKVRLLLTITAVVALGAAIEGMACTPPVCNGTACTTQAGGAASGTGSTTTATASTTVASTTVTATSTTNASTTTGTKAMAATSSTGTSSGACTDPGPPGSATLGTTDCGGMPCESTNSCDEACSVIYDCGLATCGGNAQLCPSFAGATHDTWITMQNGCDAICNQMPGLVKMIANPKDCQGTIANAKVNAQFATDCNGGGG